MICSSLLLASKFTFFVKNRFFTIYGVILVKQASLRFLKISEKVVRSLKRTSRIFVSFRGPDFWQKKLWYGVFLAFFFFFGIRAIWWSFGSIDGRYLARWSVYLVCDLLFLVCKCVGSWPGWVASKEGMSAWSAFRLGRVLGGRQRSAYNAYLLGDFIFRVVFFFWAFFLFNVFFFGFFCSHKCYEWWIYMSVGGGLLWSESYEPWKKFIIL